MTKSNERTTPFTSKHKIVRHSRGFTWNLQEDRGERITSVAQLARIRELVERGLHPRRAIAIVKHENDAAINSTPADGRIAG